MAPVRPRTSRRTVATIPTTLRHKLHLVEKCTDEEMAAHLEDFKEWVWPKGDLYAYIGVLNRLDGTLEKITNDFNLKSAGYGVQDKLFDASSKRLINAVLRFLKLLIDNCSNRKIFNSVEHLDALILTNDVEVLSNNLKLILSIQAHHRNALQLNSKALLSVAWNWPSSASLADSITTSIPPLNDTVSFQFFDTQSRSIHLEKVGENPLSDLDLHKECVDQYKIPKDGNSNNFDLYHRIRSIKVFDSPSRRHFIESRLLALSLYLQLVKESQAQHNLLIYEPTLVQQLTHLLQLPLDDEYISIQSTSLICLESLAHYKTRVSEVLSCLNAGVNQGLLFTYIRNVTNKLSQSSPPSPQLVDLVDSIFSMISHLSTSNSGGQMLVGAGLITLLINLFKVDSSTLITKCLQLLDALLYSYRNALPIFINANGLTTLVEKIHHRVLASVEHKAELEAKSDNDEDVATTFGRLPVSESQAMKSSLRSIYRLLTSSGTEGGIRNLIDTTLLQDIHLILDNRRFFGASITSFALNIMATFVHNEPTSLSIIQEAQLPAKFYNSIEEYIEPHIDILTVIFNVISACCLNENGLNEFMQRSDTIIGKIFEMFTSATHIKVLSEKENAVNIGSSVDELIRHQPSLKPKVLNAINGQLDRIAEIGGAFDCNEVGQYGLSEVARYRLLTQDEHSMVENVPNDKREDPFAMKCIDVMARFLESVFTNGTHAKEFLDAGGLERLGRFFGLPCLPYDFSISRASEAIAQLGRVLIEIKPEVTLMWSMEQVREKLESTRHIWSEMRNKSLFIKMKDLNESDYEEANATFRSLIELYSRVQLISDMFASIGFLNIRVSNGFFLPKLNEPRNLETLNMIGILDRSLTWEHLLLNAEENKETEFDWKELESGSKSSNEKYEKNLNIMMNNLDPTVNIKSGNKSDEEKKAEESTPSKLNYKSLSHLSMYIPQTATPFYQAVVKMFLYRRQSDQSHKKNSVITSKAMAQILVDHLQFTGNGDPRPSCAYMCQILKAINALFFDDRTSHNHLQTPLVFAFAQLGGVQLLTHRLDQISDELSHQTITDNEIPKSPAEMQQFRIYRILENIMPLFHTFAATRPLLESSQTGPLQLREADKSSAEYFNSNDFLVRLRSIIMPVLVKVCQSEWLSKAPLGQPTRLIVQTFLNIIKAEGEAAEPPAGPQGRLGNPPSERIGHLQDLERALFNMRSSPLHRILGEEPPTEAAQSESDATQPSEAQTSQPELPPPPHPAAESRSDVEIKVMEDIEGVMKIDRLNETLLQEMMSMDFPKYASAVALMYNGDDVAQAAEWLVARPDYVDIAREFELRQKRQKDEEKKDYETKLAEGKITPMNDNIDAVKRSLDQARQNLYSTIPSILLNLADAHYEIVFDVKDMFKDDKEKSAEQIGVKTLLDEVETLDAKDRQCEGKLYVRWHLLSVMISDHQFSQKDNVINQRERLLNLTYKSGPAVIDSQTPPKWLAPFLLASAIMLGCSEVIKTADDPTKVGENIPEVKIEEIVDTGSFEEQKNALFEIALTTFKRSKDKNWELKKADLMAVLQVLTLLTRSTRYSKDLFSAGGVQMLSSIFDGPLDNARGSTLFLSFIMRNLIEDDSLIKSTMHNELLSYFASSPTRGSSSGSKVVDVSTFTKTASPLALRDTKAFMEVIKENCMLVSDSPAAGVFHIKLRPDVVPELKSKLGDKKDGEHSGQQQRGEDMQLDDNSQAPPMPSEVLESILQFLVAELMRVGKTARKFASLAEKTDEEKKKEGEEKKNSSSEQQQEDPAQQPQSSTSAASDQEKKDEKKEESTPDGALEYFYACFILQSITEICASYPSSKVNLVMTNKKKQGGGTPFKPKVSFLNFLISELISMPSLGAPNHDNVGRKQRALAEWAIAVFVSTCSDTSPWTDSKEIPNEVVLSRKFVLDVISKLIKDNTSGVTDEDLSVRYARLTALSEIIARLIDARPVNPVTGKSSTESSVHMAKVMLEKNYVTTLTHALGDIDISFPHSKVTIGALLSPLERLTKISIKMAKNGDKKDSNSQDEQNEDEDEDEDEDDDDEDNSSDEDDIGADEMRNADRAGTPDLYRNSALGMYSGENYGEENDGDEDSEMDEEDFDDMEVDFHHHHGSGNHSESSDDDSGSSDGDSDDMEDHDEIEEGEADDWIDEEDEGEEVDFDEDAYDEEEALNPIEENPSIFDEADPVIEAPTPDEEEAESVADPEFDDDGLIDDGFSETDEDAEEEGLAFRDEADVERAPRIGSLLDGRGGMGETTAIFGSPLLGGGSSRRRMFGGGSQSFLGGNRDRLESDRELPQQPLLVDQAPPSSTPASQDTGNRRQSSQRSGAPNPLLQTIESMFGRNGFQIIEQLLQRETGGTAGGVPAGARVHLELHSPNGPSGSIPIEQLTNMHSRRQQTPQTHSANILSAVNGLAALPTFSRWYDSAKLFYGSTSQERSSKITNHIILMLLPAAREASAKARAEEAEKTKELEAKTKKDEEDKAQKEAEEKSKKEQEEKDAREKQAHEEEMREAERPQEVQSEAQAESQPQAQQQEDVEMAEDAPAEQEQDASSSAPQERVSIQINGRDVDITNTGIDPSFMEALPDDMREEVLTQHLREQRRAANSAAAQNRTTEGAPPAAEGNDDSEISMEFLNALPAEIRAEVLQQEAFESIHRGRQPEGGNERRSSQVGAVGAMGDPSPFFNSIEPSMRQFILMNGEMLDPQHDGERSMGRADLQQILGGRRPSGPRAPPKKATEKHRQKDAIQLLDKSGLAILIRLLFYPNLIKKSVLFKILANLIENSRSRNDLLLLLLNILQEGTGDLPAVDRSLSQLTLKGTKPSASTPLSTPTSKVSSKRKHTQETPASPILLQIPPETIPNLLAQRCFETLTTLVSSNSAASTFFLTEHDLSSSMRSRPSKKSKGKEKQTVPVKFPIVLLMSLLDRPTVFKTQMMMDTFTTLLATVTKPLSTLRKDDKNEKPEASGTQEQQQEQPQQQPADANVTPRPKEKEGENKKTEDEKEDEGLKTAPQIPTHVLKYVVNILTIGECTSKTFQQTLSLIQNLSFVPDAKDVIAAELKVKAQDFGQQLNGELVELGDALRNAEKSDDVSAGTMEKFLPASSLQARLLRVLKTVDYMFGQSSEMSENSEQSGEERPSSLRQVLGSLMREDINQQPQTTAEPPAATQEEAKTNELKVNAIYDSFNFGSVWQKLSENLKIIEENEQMTHIATVLLPLIESLMVVCKYVNPQTEALRTKRMTGSPVSPSANESIEDIFIDFTEEHRKIINIMVRNNPALMSGSFSLLVQNPRILEFDNKRSFFMQRLRARKRGETYPTLHVNVRRSHVFADSFQYLQRKSGDEIKYGKLSVKFHGEEGVDAGGVAREWFQVLAQQMFNPNYALFQPCDADRLTYQPNRASYVNEHHLDFFKFVGRIIGKAIYDGRLLDAYFTRSFYKHMLGRQVDFKDLESVDLSYYNSLVWMLENSLEGVLELTFSIEDDEFGVVNIIDLIPNGRNIPVTDQNKKEYVKLVTEFRLTTAIERQIQCFLEGFHEIIPKDLVKIFSENELELLISGLPDIDVDAWKNQTDYHGFTPSDPVIGWFWRVLRSFDSTQKASFLQFATGSSRVPLEGFGALQGSQGTQRFNIHKAYGAEDRLPAAHTCFNQLDLGPYSSYEALRRQILTAIHEGNTGFGFA